MKLRLVVTFFAAFALPLCASFAQEEKGGQDTPYEQIIRAVDALRGVLVFQSRKPQ